MKEILIVDDSRFMRDYIKKLLRTANFTKFIEAADGIQAIDMYMQYSPELVIMDITMPRVSGLDALKEIKRINPFAKVIICSALGTEQNVIEALKIGANDFIVKPYFNNLLPIIDRLL